MPGAVYEVRVRGSVSAPIDDLFDGATVTTESVVRAVLADQAALHGLLAWIDAHGFELIDVRRARRGTTADEST